MDPATMDPATKDPAIARALARNPVITRRRHPELAGSLARAAAQGRLVRLLPGVYTLPERSRDLATRAAAVCRYDPAAVVVGDAAAALSYWPELQPDSIMVASRQHRLERAGYTFVRRAIPPMLVHTRRGVRYTAPALTALDQVERYGAEGIDRALRSRRATVEQLRAALDTLSHRRGNTDRRAALLDSRDGGWSALERKMHRLLHDAGITGWSANVEVDTAFGDYIVDIVFHHSPLCIELDGREFHGATKFDGDRLRGNELLLAGRQVLHVTWAMIDRHADLVVETVRRALKQFGPDAARG
jgi:very-short-patch-repair endonuclease